MSNLRRSFRSELNRSMSMILSSTVVVDDDSEIPLPDTPTSDNDEIGDNPTPVDLTVSIPNQPPVIVEEETVPDKKPKTDV